ncbi:MAG TPA: hypothetical protein VJ994_04170, partial [Paracoccaceae bacterium]|nr:hypothetical protein [Paracoccaceae bacterium]
ELLGAGAYFAWLRHPFDAPSSDIARRLVEEASLLLLPGTMFTPPDDPLGRSSLRMAFANQGPDGLREAFRRLAAFTAAERRAA